MSSTQDRRERLAQILDDFHAASGYGQSDVGHALKAGAVALRTASAAQPEAKNAQWTLDNIFTIARREANRLHIPMTTERYQERWGHVLRLCEQAGCHGRGVLRDNGGPVEPLVHGQTCEKVMHDKHSGGYLHGEDDDTPYMVDRWPYCGRCHMVLELDAWKHGSK